MIIHYRRLMFNSSWPILKQQIKQHNIWATRLKCQSLTPSKKISHYSELEYTLNMVTAGNYFFFNFFFCKLSCTCVFKGDKNMDTKCCYLFLLQIVNIFLWTKKTYCLKIMLHEIILQEIILNCALKSKCCMFNGNGF